MTAFLGKIFSVSEDGNLEYYMADVTMVIRVFGMDYWSDDWKLRNTVKGFIPVFVMFLYAFLFEAYYVINYYNNADIILHSFIMSSISELAFMKLLIISLNYKKIRSLIVQMKNEFWNFNVEET